MIFGKKILNYTGIFNSGTYQMEPEISIQSEILFDTLYLMFGTVSPSLNQECKICFHSFEKHICDDGIFCPIKQPVQKPQLTAIHIMLGG